MSPRRHTHVSPCLSSPAARSNHAGPDGRLTHIDTIRGLLLVLMAVNHIPSALRAVTDHPLGFMSAAEGFVFIAGLMAGFVYTRSWLRSDFEHLRSACLHRAVTIYRWHVATFLLVIAGLVITGLSLGQLPANTPDALLRHPALAVFAGVFLVQQPALFDILPMYCVLLAITPWCLRICSNGGYGRLVFGSVALWSAANLFCPQAPFQNDLVNTGAFNLAAWQLLYVSGLAFGHRWARRQFAQAGERDGLFLIKRPAPALLIGAIAVASVLFCVRHGFIPSGLSESALSVLTNKNNLAPIRLLNTALIFFLSYLLVSRFPHAFSWRPLAWIGRASLTVFAVHVVAAYVIHAWPEFFAETVQGPWIGTACMLLTLALAAAAHDRFLAKKPASPRSSPPVSLLQTRQPRARRFIVHHEPRPPLPADSFHRRSR